MDDAAVEQACQEKGLNAPRVTMGQISKLMEGVVYHAYHIPDTTVTVVTALLPNGFALACEMSAAVALENFDAEIGKQVATGKAIQSASDKLWELEGYRLKCGLEAE